jgi:hypothetical protein
VAGGRGHRVDVAQSGFGDRDLAEARCEVIPAPPGWSLWNPRRLMQVAGVFHFLYYSRQGSDDRIELHWNTLGQGRSYRRPVVDTFRLHRMLDGADAQGDAR